MRLIISRALCSEADRCIEAVGVGIVSAKLTQTGASGPVPSFNNTASPYRQGVEILPDRARDRRGQGLGHRLAPLAAVPDNGHALARERHIPKAHPCQLAQPAPGLRPDDEQGIIALADEGGAVERGEPRLDFPIRAEDGERLVDGGGRGVPPRSGHQAGKRPGRVRFAPLTVLP